MNNCRFLSILNRYLERKGERKERKYKVSREKGRRGNTKLAGKKEGGEIQVESPHGKLWIYLRALRACFWRCSPLLVSA